MLSKAGTLCLTVAALALMAGCRSDDAPDARIAQPSLADARPVDAAGSSPDARLTDAAPGTPDARPADARAADAPVTTADAGVPDAPLQPDAMVTTPDAMVAEPDAAPPENAATVMLNEISPNGGTVDEKELIELWVTKAGNTRGIEIRQDYTGTRILAVLPDLEVGLNELIVVHLQADEEVTDESSAMDECVSSACYPGAWDVVGETATAANIGYSYRVIFVKGADGTVTDAVPFMRETDLPGTPPGAFESDLPAIIEDGLWLTECPDPCDYDNIENMYDASVDWSAAGIPPAGDTIQRRGSGFREFKVTDWWPVPVAHTMGDYNTVF